ncbi:ABC transporter permease [Pseudomonas xantholysinigenes]|uniref:Transport permease protein n=1 Tax=Pseudomonas xantholysinigenes TaxID=2745490 RepID=A0A9E6PZ85_9PSED|nr:ABC transporter permease [Pseudomonas xantholysinigenes]QXI39814.1 ABC transporter permease [Pseudomonas xantholysinigenes]
MSQIENLSPAQAFELAMGSMRQKRWVEAATLWQAFRQQYSGHPAPWLQGAVSLMRQGHYHAADELLAHARVRFAQHAATWLTCAEWARLQGDLAQESAFLSQGREQMGEQWQLLCQAADLEMRRGDPVQAQVFNAMARECAGERCEPVLQAAELAEKRGDWEQAADHWRRVIELKPEESRGYLQMANACKMQGDLVNARRYRLASQYGPEILNAVVPSPQPAALHQGARPRGRWLNFAGLVFTKAILNLKSEAARTYLNHAWVVIEPLLHLVIYYFLFGKLLNAGVENYGLFLLCGLVPWMWFSKAISTSATSILGGQSLMLNSNVSPAFFPLVSIVQSTLKQLPALLLLLLLGMATDPKSLSWALLYLPLIILVQLLLTVVLGMLLAAAVSLVRDLANLVGTGLMLLMFLSGVIYQYQTLSGAIGHWVEFNPMTLVIAAYREVILQGRAPDVASMAYVLAVALAGGVLVALIYKHQRRHFVRRGMS